MGAHRITFSSSFGEGAQSDYAYSIYYLAKSTHMLSDRARYHGYRHPCLTIRPVVLSHFRITAKPFSCNG